MKVKKRRQDSELTMKNKFSDHYSSTSRGAYNVKKGLTLEEIKEMLIDKHLHVILFDNLTKIDFENLEKHIFSKNPKVLLSKIRSNFLPKPLDLDFLRYLPSLKRLRICDATVLTKFDVVELMTELEELSFYNCEPKLLDILKTMPPNLKSLSIEATLSKNYNIDYFSRFHNLKYLHIEGPCKGVEEIGQLNKLQELTLRSISLPNINFLKNLSKLWSIDLKLGGIKDFSILEDLPNIKYLELWLIKGLKDISFISKMKGLQNIHLESLTCIEELPSLNNLSKLRRIKLMNLNGLKNLNAIKTAPKLQDFFFTMINKLQPSNLTPVLENPNIKNLYIYFPSDKKNKEFDVLANKYGKNTINFPDYFHYEK